MTRTGVAQEIAAVSALCRELGLGEVAPTLLKAAHHTSLLVSPIGLVARVQSGEPIARALENATREIDIARHLMRGEAPVLAPIEGLAGPHLAGGSVVTFWPYMEQARPASEANAEQGAEALAYVHRALRDFGGNLPPFTKALDRCWAVLADRGGSDLSIDDRGLLQTQFRRLRRLIEDADVTHMPLHGDAHLGNLLVGPGGLVWLDFEDACIGPREYDIASLPAVVWPRFGDVDLGLVAACAGLRSVCVAVWCAADMLRSPEIAEAAACHLQIVREMAEQAGG